MADLKAVGVRLYALNDDYKRGMRESADSTNAFSKASTFALAAVGTAAVGFAVKAADAYVNYGKSVMGLSRLTGENIETSSKMAFSAQQSGLSVDQLGKAYKFLEQNMAAGKAVFEKNGIAIKDNNGQMRDAHAVFLDVADKVAKTTNATDRLAIASGAFGSRMGKDMLPMLMRGRDGILALEAGAEKYGLVLSKDNVAAISDNIKAHRNLDAAMQGLQVRVGQEVLPALTGVTAALASIPGPALAAAVPIIGVTAALVSVVKVGQTLAPVVSTVADLGKKAIGAGDGFRNMSTGAVAGTAAVAGLVAVGIEYVRILNEQKDGLEKIGNDQAAGDSYDQLTAHIKKTGDELAKQRDAGKNSFWFWDRTAADAAGDALEKNKGKLEDFKGTADALAAATGDNTDKTLKWVQSEAAAGRTYDNASTAISAYTGVLDTSTMSEQDATEAIKARDDATKAMNDTEHASIDPQFAMIDATNKNRDAQRKSADARWAVVAAQSDYNTAVRNYGSASFEAMAKLQALNDAKQASADADENATKSAADLDYATNNLKNAQDTQRVSTGQSIDLLNGWVASGKITAQQAYATAQQFGILGDYLRQIPGDVYITIHRQEILSTYVADQDAGHRHGQNAVGGKLADGWSTVGERGIEWIHNQGGVATVTPAASDGRVLIPAGAGGGRGGGPGPTVNNYYTTVDAPNYVGDKRDFQRLVEDGVRKASRN